MPVVTEERAVLATLERVETIEQVASTLDESDARRATLRQVVADTLASTPPIRPRTASTILGLSEKTVRSWVSEGVLSSTATAPRLLLDPSRLHEVFHLIRALRAAGQQRGLLDEVYRRLSDAALLDREDLQESLAQMRRGEVADFQFRYPASEDPVDRVDA